MLGLRFRSEGSMIFDVRGGELVDMALVRGDLHLYFISDGSLIQKIEASHWGLNPLNWELYRVPSDAEYMLESFEELDMEEGDEVNLE